MRYARFRVFFRMDDGVQMDEESFWSTTPEGIARHQAARCKGRYAFDACCGVGGNTVQLAATC